MTQQNREHGILQLFTRQSAAGENSAELVVKGQGTVSALVAQAGQPFSITFMAASGTEPALGLDIDRDVVRLWCRMDGTLRILGQEKAANIGLNPTGEDQPYWLSLDSNNGRVRYGKGEMLRELMLYEYSWPSDPNDNPLAFTKTLARVEVTPVPVAALQLLPIPVNLDPSPFVVPADAVTLESLSINASSVVADLPQACQQLYATVAGRGMTLRPADFPDFPEAIQHSILTPGCICYDELAKKDPAFGYLRITIDGNLGDSPGQPYVLEVWPAGNGSPIHNHGRACAIIHVLYGSIDVSLFATLSPALTQPWGKVSFTEGQVTFLTPDYYQIHQLQNPLPKGGRFCATIQSYRYPDSDHVHYEYFDYIEDGEIRHFTPDSDWTYLDFKRLIRAEWTAAHS